jgi:hypothetical protein
MGVSSSLTGSVGALKVLGLLCGFSTVPNLAHRVSVGPR